MQLEGKVTLITGGASGQGRVAAVEFARAGSAVVIADVDGSGLSETTDLIVAEGGRAQAVVGSVADAHDVDRMVTTAVEVYGHLDVLYNNAAIYLPGRGDAPVADLEESFWQQILDVNLKGVFLCAKRAIPELRRARGGAIVNIASLGGTRGSRSAHAYAAAKGGVIALTYSMAVTYGPDNIRVNAIAPGAIDTPMMPRLDDGGLARMRDHTPLGRIGTPAEVARVALFLASDAAAYITGTVQIVDGGFTLG